MIPATLGDEFKEFQHRVTNAIDGSDSRSEHAPDGWEECKKKAIGRLRAQYVPSWLFPFNIVAYYRTGTVWRIYMYLYKKGKMQVFKIDKDWQRPMGVAIGTLLGGHHKQ